MSGLFSAIRPLTQVAARSQISMLVSRQTPALALIARRFYADGPSHEEVAGRVLDILKNYEKVDAGKVSLSAHFIKDLGLDSLDTVELIMAMEDEFSLAIPDKDAEKIFTAEDVVKYIVANS
eukprot:comp16773_c0_seq1/m.15140 comp16773_c0_seq1/g.15140  ORF comp16773_c0_seq1/g.15140 comp16773_c0_seq1/m.15140 type:complete len:122 (-) comp16773_c0_seq1:781-1146(-)